MSDMSTVVVIPTATACECTRASNGGPLHRDGVEEARRERLYLGCIVSSQVSATACCTAYSTVRCL
jgi:hypothetical protein